MVVIKVPPVIWSYLSGVIYSLAWLLMIDQQIYDLAIRQGDEYPGHNQPTSNFEWYYWFIVIMPSMGWAMLNAPSFIFDPRRDVAGETADDEDENAGRYACGKVWIATSLLLTFGGCVLGVVLMAVEMIKFNAQLTSYGIEPNLLGPLCLLGHPLLSAVSAVCFFLGRVFGDKISRNKSSDF